MKSLVQAINNLANSISSLAESKKSSTSQPASKATTSNPYAGTVNITSTYISKDSEGWYTLNAAEKEQLYYIYKAILDKGVIKKDIYATDDINFNKLMDVIHKSWPSIHAPIEKLILLKKRSIQDKYNRRINPSSKEVWKFPHEHENS
jgi:hypothetical protein